MKLYEANWAASVRLPVMAVADPAVTVALMATVLVWHPRPQKRIPP
jgi:hypothetical protein